MSARHQSSIVTYTKRNAVDVLNIIKHEAQKTPNQQQNINPPLLPVKGGSPNAGGGSSFPILFPIIDLGDKTTEIAINLGQPFTHYQIINITEETNPIDVTFDGLIKDRSILFTLDITIDTPTLPTINWPANLHDLPTLPTTEGSRYILTIIGFRNDSDEQYYVVNSGAGGGGSNLWSDIVINTDKDMQKKSLTNVSGIGFVDTSGNAAGAIVGVANELDIVGINSVGSIVFKELLTNRLILDFVTNSLQYEDVTPLFKLKETTGSTVFTISKLNGRTEFNDAVQMKFQINLNDIVTVTNTTTKIFNNITLGDAIANNLVVNARVNSDFLPAVDQFWFNGDDARSWLVVASAFFRMTATAGGAGSSNFQISTDGAQMRFNVPSTKFYTWYVNGSNIFRLEEDADLQWLISGKQHKIGVTSTALQLFSEDQTDSIDFQIGTLASNWTQQILSGSLELQYPSNNPSIYTQVYLSQMLSTPANGMPIAFIRFDAQNSAAARTPYAGIFVDIGDKTSGAVSGDFYINVVSNNSTLKAIRFLGSTSGLKIGFFNGTPAIKPTITGSKGGNAALASLLTGLASMGLVADSTT